MERTIAGLTMVHETFDEATPIEYHFLDSQIELFYQNDRVAGKIFFIGSFLTITISCMGLFGLASFTMQRRMKEISLRKVLGASTQNLFLLLIKSFSIQILISLVVASPIAYFLMDNWLESFAYRQGINMAPFLTAGAVALLIAIVTVSYSCLKAVTSNPAETLKHQ